MRNLIVANIMSLDGFYEGPHRNVMALPMDAAFDAYNAERLRAAHTLLLGRKTFDMFQGFWPAMADNPQASAANREISRLDNAIQKVVISDGPGNQPDGPWRSTTETVSRAKAHAHIAELKRRPGKDILVFGSRTLWNDLLRAGLVDELHLMVGSVGLGSGTAIFDQALPAPLRLLATRTWEGSSNVLMRYAVGAKG
jgi:dihydrofolate reductase